MINNNKILELESLRGLAALLVLFFHIPKWNPVLDINFLHNADLAVDLFFVISGYVIYKSYGTKIFSFKDLFNFLFLRVGRIYPLHILFLIVYVLFELSKYFVQLKLQIYPNTPVFSSNNFQSFFNHVLLIQTIGVSPFYTPITYNAASWSISVEFFAYIFFGITILLTPKIKNLTFCILALISIILLIFGKANDFYYFLRGTAGFFIGCLIFFITQQHKAKFFYINFFNSRYYSLIVLLLIVLFLQFKTIGKYNLIIFLLSSMLIFSLVVIKDGYLNKFLNNKILIVLGTLSYSIYMSHSAIIWIFQQFFRVILEKSIFLIDGQNIPQLSIIETFTAVILLIIVVFIISRLTYSCIEVPLRNRSRKFILGSKVSLD